MLAGRSFKPRTAAQREAAQERYNNRYERIYHEIEDQLRAEWVEQSAGDLGPVPPMGQRIHELTVARIAQEGDD